ncbi:hypothetical protein GCM10023065_31950 [Microbacterium laevaniformans]
MGLDFVRVNIAEDLLGKKDGQRFLPILTTMFFMILFFNITGIIPFMNLAGTSIIAVPLMLAVISYVTFIYAGIKKSPKNFFKNALFPSGVPPFLYIIVTPLEFLSTFIIRPVTLTLRLLMNMIVGHLMLVLFFLSDAVFLITLGGWWSALAAGSLAFGLAFTLFEILVAFLQAYVFTILTAVYIQLAVAEEHWRERLPPSPPNPERKHPVDAITVLAELKGKRRDDGLRPRRHRPRHRRGHRRRQDDRGRRPSARAGRSTAGPDVDRYRLHRGARLHRHRRRLHLRLIARTSS